MSKEKIKLKVASEEIKEILKKHDIAGVVALHIPGHGEHIIHVHTSYSCAYIYDDNSIRFYSKEKDYSSREEHVEKVKSTSNMMKILADMTGILYLKLDKLSRLLDTTIGAEHTKPRLSDNTKDEI